MTLVKVRSRGINLADTFAFTGTISGGTSTPAFQARRASTLTFSDNTATKVTGFSEDFDTDNNFASDRFTPTTAGKYFVTVTGNIHGVTNYDMYNGKISIYKNGSEFAYNTQDQYRGTGLVSNCMCQCIVSCNGTGDYFEMYAKHNGGGNAIQGSNSTFMIMRIA